MKQFVGTVCVANSQKVSDYAEYFLKEHWSFLGPGCEEKWYGTHTYKSDGRWNHLAEKMMAIFTKGGHRTFRASSAWNRGTLKSEGGG